MSSNFCFEKTDIDFIENLFNSLDINNEDFILSSKLLTMIEKNGIQLNDYRIKNFISELKKIDGVKKEIKLDITTFTELFKKDIKILKKIFSEDLIIVDFEDFQNDINNIYKKTINNRSGKNASYIPELEKVNPELYGISVCTIDGQICEYGDSDFDFCLQSCSKPISYLIAVEENGFNKVHECMGCEPSGVEFNKAVLKKINDNKEIPHNPMINAGAIMSCSLIQINKSQTDKFNKVMDVYKKLTANSKVGFQNSTYLSEKADADRNICLGFMMKEKKSYLEHVKTSNDIFEILEFYFQTCSIEMNCRQLSILASTLANGGINPITNEKVFDPENVKNCLSIMNSCGMYDYSGEWAFKVGIPAKSGVGGGIFLVIPGVMGLATFSPRLDKNGNSVRGIDFATEFTKIYNFHQFDSMFSKKKNPLYKNKKKLQNDITNLLYSSSIGDLEEIKKLRIVGFDITLSDYDNRTALHLAASEGHYNIIKYFINYCKKYNNEDYLERKDRWGRTALDDALSNNNNDIIELLTKNIEKLKMIEE